MHNLLTKLLQKRRIKDITELSKEEKADVDKWQKILSEEEITVDKIVAFCKAQIKIIETNWKNLDNQSTKNERLIVLHTVYSTLIEVIGAPKIERETLEKYLNDLLQT